MPVTPQTIGGVPHYLHEPALPPRLNLTAGRWQLTDGFVSVLIGLDVSAPFEMRPSRRRRPLPGLVDASDLPLCHAAAFDTAALVTQRVSGILALQGEYKLPTQSVYRASGTAYATATGVVTDTIGGSFDGFVPAGTGTTEVKTGDYFLCHRPLEMRGPHKILEKSNTTTFRIAPNLTAADVVGPDLEGIIVSGRQWMTNVDLPSATYGVKTWFFPSRKLLASVPAEAVGSTLTHNADRRLSLLSETLRVDSVEGFAAEADALALNRRIISTADSKITLLMTRLGDLRGVILTNGRKFWRHQHGVVTLLLDLGDDAFLGTVWRMTVIASNRLLLTHPGYVPRVLHLFRDSPDLVVPDEVYAGCVPPVKPASVEVLNDDEIRNASWLARRTAGSNQGLTTAGSVQILVRGVNLVDGIASALVPVGQLASLTDIPTVAEGAAGSYRDIPTTLDKAVSVCTQINQEDGSGATKGFTPPMHARITHIEVWRTQAAARSNFYLESRMEIADHEQGNELANSSTNSAGRAWFGRTPLVYPIRLADDNVLRLPVLTDADRLAGGLPPICREAVSLLGVTLCFGKSAEMPEVPRVYARNFFTTNAYFNLATGVVTLYGPGGSTQWDAYVFQEGDELIVTYTGPDAPQVSLGAYSIASSGTGTVTLDDPPYGTGVLSGVHGHIRRSYPIEWPRIQSDEDVWYSRTDQFAPENFPPRIKQLSRSGDMFRRAVTVNDTVAVIMAQGVHVLYLAGGDVQVEAIAATGAGTPWPDSVVMVGRSVLWADSQGIRRMVTYADRNQDGQKAVLSRVEDQNFEPFFREALDGGYNIDSGFDPRREMIRFRRTKEGLPSLTLVGSFRTGKWALEEEDEGLVYAASAYTEEGREIPALHTVESRTGRLLLLHDDRTDHPYTGYVTTAQVGGEYKLTTTSLENTRRSVFTPLMAGDVVAFVTLDSSVERVILTATDRKLTFDHVTAIVTGDTFHIGRPEFRMRLAPFMGDDPQATHALYSAVARIREGETRPGTDPAMTVNVYRDYEDDVVDSAAVPIFNSGRDSSERIPLLQGEGHALELELTTRDDFTLEHLAFTVREEGGGHPGPEAT